MNRDDFIKRIDEKLRLIRNEKEFTQDKMADIIGISKKTLVQIEKGRTSLGWTGAVAIATLFRDSEVLHMIFGGDPQDIILALAFENYEVRYENTMGGKVWWQDIKSKDNYRIQQNIISKHFRILDKEDRRISSSFDKNFILQRFGEL